MDILEVSQGGGGGGGGGRGFRPITLENRI